MAKWEDSRGLTGLLGTRVARWTAIGASLMVLAACSSLPPAFSPLPPVAVYGPHYCYRTLAQVDCHDDALTGESDRQMGHYEPAGDPVDKI